MILGTRYGLGKHVSAINSETGSLYLRYYRLLAIQQMKTVYKVAILIVSGWALAQLFISIFACWPVQGFWDKTVEARCIPNQPQWYINAAGNILTDVIVLLLPLPAIRSLRLPRNQKLILAGIFSLGFLSVLNLLSSTVIANSSSTVILSAIRIKYLQEFEDFTWEHVESHLWSMAELTSAPICASLPKLRPFVIHYFPDFASKLTRSFRGYVGGQRSRIHSGSDDFTPRQEIIPFKSSDQGTDQPLQNGAAFKMQPQDYSKAFGYSGNRLDEDLVGLWATVDVETSVVMPASGFASIAELS
ncbi:hypothetical protein FOXB_15755 [Fusarium oxysporum f. sp. conglutinans Fo5176]|uniref:Rhodopsin domain-containing protein n=1 Tax=Fusarium oxysporum (strain Fo5176) TaxID=660025 RepID=F9GAS3_FUSOF|nr:hypothetical protein FOXB_15755 [Fusarium oxysporum f. sp. conglutinans Fo5176]